MAKDTLKEQEEMQKRVAYYQTLISTWISNRMELDKRILTLSLLTIGYLITFQSNIDDIYSSILWFSAFGFFAFSIGLILLIFQQNCEYIETMHNEDEDKVISVDKSLELKTRLALYSFATGIGLTFTLAIYRILFLS